MPRELVHWHILEAALDLRVRSRADRLSELIQEHRAAAYIGAIAHDAPYFFKAGSGSLGSGVSKLIHGSDGRDTLDPIRNMARAARSVDDGENCYMWSLIAGMISHIAVDIAFHPMIYFLTGDFDDLDPHRQRQVRARHCIFEVYLDHWWDYHGPDLWNRNLISRVIEQLDEQFHPICWLLAKSLDRADSKNFNPGHWQMSLESMAMLQRLFYSDSLGAIINVATMLSGERLISKQALFAFERRAVLPYFDRPIFWKNPVDGSSHWSMISALAETAVEHCIALWDLLARFMEAEPMQLPFEGYKTGSLSFGLVGAKLNDGRYYAEDPVALEDRRL